MEDSATEDGELEVESLCDRFAMIWSSFRLLFVTSIMLTDDDGRAWEDKVDLDDQTAGGRIEEMDIHTLRCTVEDESHKSKGYQVWKQKV